MTAQEILKMIETVDPNDTAKLDEIDARVWCFLTGYKFAATKHDRIFVIDEYQCEIEKLNGICTLKYTSSRDALKQIRPYQSDYSLTKAERFFFDLFHPTEKGQPFDGYVQKKRFIGIGATEELAELAAIIQAIEYERSHK